MRRRLLLRGMVASVMLAMSMAATAQSVFVVWDGGTQEIVLDTLPAVSGVVSYQGPVFDSSDANWKESATYEGVALIDILAAAGIAAAEGVDVVAGDGYSKWIPAAVLTGGTPAGTVALALDADDEAMLVFLPADRMFSNEDMLAAFGAEGAHYFGEMPSTTGFRVNGVAQLVVDGATPLSFDELVTAMRAAQAAPPPTADDEILLSVIHGDVTLDYTRFDLRQLEQIEAAGTFTNSAGIDYTATYTGVPMSTFIGNVPGDATIRVTASDGYSMNYEAEMLLDTSVGVWVLAYMENGETMPFDPGPLRIVQIGDPIPHFPSSLSARMVVGIEVLGAYEPYTLETIGAVERTFTRSELEAGIGCPCHTSTVTVTSKGETHTYTGLPLWRLVAFVDDDVFPALEEGLHYNDTDFSDAAAASGYTVALIADDDYTQEVSSDLIARDDRFVVAFKKDGVFLEPDSDGFMRFVYDDSVELPAGISLRSVKFLARIELQF
ncbi:hypothetical protein JW848_01810 [Candidatus Bipolaricaulota bacterium]|nr:hypothetical protein [Candidatus Bipolaricaulota bacterium]